MKFRRSVLVFLTVAWTAAAHSAPARTDVRPAPPATMEQPAPPPDSGAIAAGSAHPLTAEDIGPWLEGFMRFGLKSGDVAGATISVVKDGHVLFQSGYGYADVEKKAPMDAAHTLVRIGSISKLFAWTAVMQLVEQGKLDLQRNVDDYLDFKVSPTQGRPITLLDLMNHRGGFEEGLKDILAVDPRLAQKTETYLKTHPRPLLFAPGTVPAYSNYGTAVAGYIVERVSGQPFERYVEEHIFHPLGMDHSTFEQPLPARFAAAMSRGYRSASTPALPFELIATAPAGSVSATAADMAQFMLAHLQHGQLGDARILSAETAQLMYSPSEQALPGFATMAHGFFLEPRNGRTLMGHGGDTLIFHAELELLPQEGVGIFCGFNSRGREDAVYLLRKELLDQFLDRYFPRVAPVPEIHALASAATDAGRIAGRYESSRRVEHGFLGAFYLMQQKVISANADGTLSAPKAFEPGEEHYQEIAPDLWRETGGTHQLALRKVDGVDTVLDSEDPTSVLQRAPLHRTAPVNLTVLVLSALTLLLAVILWPVQYLVRRHYGSAPAYPAEGRRWRTLLRIGAGLDLVWLVAWGVVLMPVLSVQVDHYGTALDPTIRALQIFGLIVPVLAVVGLVSLWRLLRLPTPWPQRLGSGLIAAALLGMVWIGLLGNLIGFDLNY